MSKSQLRIWNLLACFLALHVGPGLAGCSAPQDGVVAPNNEQTTDVVAPPKSQGLTLVSVEPIPMEEGVVIGENFEGEPAKWKWSVPGGIEPSTSPQSYITDKGGPGPMLRAGNGFDAGSIERIRVEVLVEQLEGASATPVDVPELILYWAGPEDVAASQWPFSNERSLVLKKIPDAPGGATYGGELMGRPEWKGRIERAFLGFSFTQAAEGKPGVKYRIAMRRIDWVAKRPVPSTPAA